MLMKLMCFTRQALPLNHTRSPTTTSPRGMCCQVSATSAPPVPCVVLADGVPQNGLPVRVTGTSEPEGVVGEAISKLAEFLPLGERDGDHLLSL